jgi:hypothetical protein
MIQGINQSMVGPAGFEPTIRQSISTDIRSHPNMLTTSSLRILRILMELRGCYH